MNLGSKLLSAFFSIQYAKKLDKKWVLLWYVFWQYKFDLLSKHNEINRLNDGTKSTIGENGIQFNVAWVKISENFRTVISKLVTNFQNQVAQKYTDLWNLLGFSQQQQRERGKMVLAMVEAVRKGNREVLVPDWLDGNDVCSILWIKTCYRVLNFQISEQSQIKLSLLIKKCIYDMVFFVMKLIHDSNCNADFKQKNFPNDQKSLHISFSRNLRTTCKNNWRERSRFNSIKENEEKMGCLERVGKSVSATFVSKKGLVKFEWCE